jgi:hypothetical protein
MPRLLIFLAACTAHQNKADPQESAAPQVIERGAQLQAANPVPIATLLQAPADYVGKTVQVTGYVRKACENKGCWLELSASREDEGQGARVTFKDYAFFVPLDAAGSLAKLDGLVEAQVVPSGHVEHYESEGAHFADKQPDGSAREVRIVATGIQLWREG